MHRIEVSKFDCVYQNSPKNQPLHTSFISRAFSHHKYSRSINYYQSISAMNSIEPMGTVLGFTLCVKETEMKMIWREPNHSNYLLVTELWLCLAVSQRKSIVKDKLAEFKEKILWSPWLQLNFWVFYFLNGYWKDGNTGKQNSMVAW